MIMMLISVLVTTFASLPLAFITKDTQLCVYPLIALQGIGIAIMLNTATSLISDVIGDDSDNSAFVYGCYSFFERCSNGILLYFFISLYSENGFALRILVSSMPTLCALFCFLLAWIG